MDSLVAAIFLLFSQLEALLVECVAAISGIGSCGEKQKRRIADLKLTDDLEQEAELSRARELMADSAQQVPPWAEEIKWKPIIAVADCTGHVASRLSAVTFAQFGSSDRCDVTVVPGVRSVKEVCDAVEKAAGFTPTALVVYTLADPELSDALEKESEQRGVACINVMEPVLRTMEKHFDLKRSLRFSLESHILSIESEGMTAYAVSDSSGSSTYSVVCAALQQFVGSGVENVTMCPYVHTLAEIRQIVDDAEAHESFIIFSFASPGMSRFMRQQCERSDVAYADV